MAIELNQEEGQLVKDLLERALGEIKAEIRHTDTASFRDELHEREIRMQALLERL